MPLATVSDVTRPAKPTERLPGLVASCGSTTKASASVPNTQGAAGATARQKRPERTARGGHRRVPGARGARTVSGARQMTTMAVSPISTCGK